MARLSVKENRPRTLAGDPMAKSDQNAAAGSESAAALKSLGVRSLQQPVHLTKAARQESPTPAFEFKRGKTRFRKRMLVQHKQQQQQQRCAADEKRIREMIAYFARLDKQAIEVE